ncbi:hypothetical protein FORC066_4139 [Yersinia enterocolitica]|nr:hypothetical protein FORC066_4139 [Yersinia enterocolitica]
MKENRLIGGFLLSGVSYPLQQFKSEKVQCYFFDYPYRAYR